MTPADSLLLHLLRKAFDPSFPTVPALFQGAGWAEMIDSSFGQDVAAVAVDGYIKAVGEGASLMYTALDSEELEDLKLEWLSSVLLAEEDAHRQEEAVASLAEAYSRSGIGTMILKGYGLSFCWPVPAHRMTGDIDVFLFGEWKRADDLMRGRGIKVDAGHEHHTVFPWEGFVVENHYDFINTRAHRDARRIENRLKELVSRDLRTVRAGDESVFIPGPDFNVIFLIRHLGQHFAGARVTLRQVSDWGLFLRAEGDKVDWEETVPFLKEMGIWTFFNQINAICVDHLGIRFPDAVPAIERDQVLELHILEDILHPEFTEEEPRGLLPRLVFKLKRWWHNRWKHPLVYDEWLLPMFLTLLWSHLRKLSH